MHEDRGINGHRGSDDHRGSMSVTMPSMLPSIPKGDIVEILVSIDVNPGRTPIAPKVWLWNP
jgi:hypothetical protein